MLYSEVRHKSVVVQRPHMLVHSEGPDSVRELKLTIDQSNSNRCTELNFKDEMAFGGNEKSLQGLIRLQQKIQSLQKTGQS